MVPYVYERITTSSTSLILKNGRFYEYANAINYLSLNHYTEDGYPILSRDISCVIKFSTSNSFTLDLKNFKNLNGTDFYYEFLMGETYILKIFNNKIEVYSFS